MNKQRVGGTTSGCVIPNQRVVVVSAPVQIPSPQTDGGDPAGLRIQRDGELVRSIEVTCSCGEVIRLECDYPEAPATDA